MIKINDKGNANNLFINLIGGVRSSCSCFCKQHLPTPTALLMLYRALKGALRISRSLMLIDHKNQFAKRVGSLMLKKHKGVGNITVYSKSIVSVFPPLIFYNLKNKIKRYYKLMEGTIKSIVSVFPHLIYFNVYSMNNQNQI